MQNRNNYLISIIVPMYNVESYLPECLDSILNQSYTNIEVILINDGSPDNSCKIALDYSNRDQRIIVFDRTNEGVSSARNFGLSKVTGDYVIFVDSDDVLLPDFVEYMLMLATSSKSEFCLSKFVATNKTYIDNQTSDSIKILSSEDATCLLLYPEVAIGCWNKIYNTSFLKRNEICFPTNFFMGEGLNFITKVAQLSNNVCVGEKPVYYYRRDNEDSATKKFDIKKIDNAFKAIDNIRDNLIIQSNKVKKALEFHYWFTNFYALQSIVTSNEESNYKKELKVYYMYLKRNAMSMISSEISFKMRLKVLLIWLFPFNILKKIVLLKY